MINGGAVLAREATALARGFIVSNDPEEVVENIAT